jgi:TonB family protein
MPPLLLFAIALTSTVAVGQCKLDKYSVVGGTLLRYPPLAQSAQIGGEVVVSFDVDSEGNLTNVRALSGHALLADSTAGMVRSWKLQSDDRMVTSVRNCRVVFSYSILPSKDPGCNELVRPQILRVSFEGAARVQITASPRFTHFCDSFGPDSP